MSRFLYDIGTCISYFAQFMSRFANSFWVYPIIFFVFISVIFYLISDNR